MFGTLSIVSWLFAQLPQIYKNHQLQSTAGLSLFFLVEWCLGDSTNLLGALFTHQAGWQVIVASYYVFVDICLVWQYFWYTHIKPVYIRGTSLHSDASSMADDGDSDAINELSPINSNFGEYEYVASMAHTNDLKTTSPTKPVDTPRFFDLNYRGDAPRTMDTAGTEKSGDWGRAPSITPRTILQSATMLSMFRATTALPILSSSMTKALPARNDNTLELTGTILSWSSTLLYLGSRLPQLYKNWERQSTAGLSPLLFFAAFCGNFFYSTSLLTNPNAWNDYAPHGGHGWAGEEGSHRQEWVARAAPFFLGAAGVLVMDALMGLQFLLYGERDEEKLVRVRTAYGTSHWEKVSGWMRGWIPSVPGKERVVDLAESQRLLSASREQDRQHRDGVEHADYGAT